MVKRRTDNIMVKRRRTDNIMVKRRRTDNIMVKRRRDKIIYFMSFIVQISPFVHLFTLKIVFRWGA